MSNATKLRASLTPLEVWRPSVVEQGLRAWITSSLDRELTVFFFSLLDNLGEQGMIRDINLYAFL